MTFKNDIISISYDFWSEGGRVSFLIKNNSDKDIYLNLDRSHLIKNGIAFDYFLQRTYSQSKTYGSSSSLSAGKEKSLNAQASKNIIYMGEPMNIGASSGSLSFTTESSTKFEQYSEGLTCKEQAVICIPARSAKYFTEFNITSEVYKEDQLQIAPKTESSIIEFNNSDSPISIQNRLNIRIGEEEEHTYINTFYVSYIFNAACPKTQYNYIDRAEYYSSPSRFYLKYKLTPAELQSYNTSYEIENYDMLY